MQKLDKRLITVSLTLLSILTTANPAKANMFEWVRTFNNQVRNDYRQAVDCSYGNLDTSTCQSLDRRVQRGIRINQGAAASQAIRNSVQKSNYNLINSKNYHNAIRNTDYYCNTGDVSNCRYWLRRVELYRQP